MTHAAMGYDSSCTSIAAHMPPDVLLITDAEDNLACARVEHEGWSVGLYAPGDHSEGQMHTARSMRATVRRC